MKNNYWVKTVIGLVAFDLAGYVFWVRKIQGELSWKSPSWLLDGLPIALALCLMAKLMPRLERRAATFLMTATCAYTLTYGFLWWKFTSAWPWLLFIQLLFTTIAIGEFAQNERWNSAPLPWIRICIAAVLAGGVLMLAGFVIPRVCSLVWGIYFELDLDILKFYLKGFSLCLIYMSLRSYLPDYLAVGWVTLIASLTALPGGWGTWTHDVYHQPIESMVYLAAHGLSYLIAVWLGSRPLRREN